ncbi:hypothetical protein Tco_0359547 [Tanacetum coccineum]
MLQQELKTLFHQQAEQRLRQTTRDFTLQTGRRLVSSSYVLNNESYIDNSRGFGLLRNTMNNVNGPNAVSMILIGLHKEFDGFVQNYNMHSLGKTVNELHAMIKLHEQTLTLPKNNAPALHAIRAGKVQKELVRNRTLEEERPPYFSRVARRRKRTQPLELVVQVLRAIGKLKPGSSLYEETNGQRKDLKQIGRSKTEAQGAVDMEELAKLKHCSLTSSAEAEYKAAFDASKEAVWVRKFISGLGVVPQL